MGKTFSQLAQNPVSFPSKEIDILELGGMFTITTMSGRKHRELIKERAEIKDVENESESIFWATLLSKCLQDDEGKNPPVDLAMEWSLKLLRKLGKEALEFNRLDAESQEQIEKN
jgi:hypothetical protein